MLKHFRFLILAYFFLLFIVNFTSLSSVKADGNKIVVQAEVTDAQEIDDFSPLTSTVNQQAEIQILEGERQNVSYDVSISLPNSQVARPLKIGELILVEYDSQSQIDTPPAIVGVYRQNNVMIILIFTLSILGISLYNSSKFKYFFLILIYISSSIIVLVTYKSSILSSIIGTTLLSSLIFAFVNYRLFHKLSPNLFLLVSYFSGLILAFSTNFILYQLNIFDSNIFQLFISSDFFRSDLTSYLFSLLSLSPIFLYLCSRVINKSITIKSENFDITRIKLISLLTHDLFKEINILIIAFSSIILSISVILASPFINPELNPIIVLNNYAFAQIIGFMVSFIFSIVIFVPILSLISGSWFGNIESHKLIDDRNYSKFDK